MFQRRERLAFDTAKNTSSSGVSTIVVSDQLPGTFFGPSTLIELLRYRMQVQPDDMAYTYLVDGESEKVSITYRELDRQARAIAAWLVGHGLTGERA